MTLGEKLSRLRRENNITQEQLAASLGVSRQSVSKWESNAAYPEREKLIRLSQLFDCSLDYLMKEEIEHPEPVTAPQTADTRQLLSRCMPEWKSERSLWGMPLWQVGKNACGVFALGLRARGIVAVGVQATGLISLGMVSLGLLSIGMLSIGLLCAGCFAMGVVAAGAIALGIIALGAVAIGCFSVGALAVGKYFAIGDTARAMIALGKTQATGSVFGYVGSPDSARIMAVKQLLTENVPGYLAWAAELIKAFL